MGKRNRKVDFYLTSCDLDGTGGVREVRRVKRLRYGSRDDLLLVKVTPPFSAPSRGAEPMHRQSLIIASLWVERPLFPVSGWPIGVYILSPRRAGLGSVDEVFDKDFKTIGWGELYPTGEWAEDPYGHAKSLLKDKDRTGTLRIAPLSGRK